MIKALVFDVYGTLLNTRACSLIIMKSVLKNCNCSLNESFVYKEWRKDIDKIIKELNAKNKFKTERVFFKEALNRTMKRLGIKGNKHEEMRLYSNICWSHRHLFPETLNALKKLRKKYKIFIASNSDTKPLLDDFKRSNLKVDKIITSEMLKVYKPHKKFFIKTLNKLKIKKDEILYIGDSLTNDVAGPHKSGIKVVWINRKNEKRKANDPKPEFIIKSLDDLISLKINKKLFL